MSFLKDCPKCGMTVAAHCECPVCKADITDLPYSESRGERYRFNKYFWPYFFKKCWFFLFCFAAVILKLVLFGVTDRIDNSGLTGLCVFNSFLWLAFSFWISFFPEWSKAVSEWRFNDSYIDMIHHPVLKYIYGILALGFAITW